MMSKVKSPISWYGGKYYMAGKLADILPEHKTYVEVFGGAGHLLFKKEKSQIEVWNDIDNGLYNFFKLLRNENKANKLKRVLDLTPHSREEFYDCMRSWKDESDEIERVRKWCIQLMQSYSGLCVSWSHSTGVSRRGMSQATSKYLGNIEENLPNAVERLRTVQIEHMDCIGLINKYDSEETLFYLDPPYIHDTRKESAKFVYNHETTDSQHNKLVEKLLHIKGKAILSGYEHEIYNSLIDNGWKKQKLGDFAERSTPTTMTKKGKGSREEAIWLNF